MKILVVDDDIQLRDFILEVLRPLGHRVVTANNGHEGFSIFKELQPSLVITDLQMPIMGGLEFIKLMRELSSAVPIIAISGENKIFPEALTLGASVTLEKPFSVDKMFSLAQGYLL